MVRRPESPGGGGAGGRSRLRESPGGGFPQKPPRVAGPVGPGGSASSVWLRGSGWTGNAQLRTGCSKPGLETLQRPGSRVRQPGHTGAVTPAVRQPAVPRPCPQNGGLRMPARHRPLSMSDINQMHPDHDQWRRLGSVGLAGLQAHLQPQESRAWQK